MSSHPNKALSDSEFTWSPKNSENDVDVGEIEELDNEYDFNDVDFDEDDDGNFDHYSISNNKRSPNSVSMLENVLNSKSLILIGDSFCSSGS